jgi:hypothetical protein
MGQFFRLNWAAFLVRAAMESVLFYGWQHGFFDGTHTILSIPVPKIALPQDSYFISAGLGFVADILLDWATTSEKVPAWLRETVPPLDPPPAHKQ